MAAFGRLLRAELLKLWSLPHIPVAAAGTFVVATAAAAAVAWAHAAGAAAGGVLDQSSGAVAGLMLPVVQTGASVVGVIASASEYDGRQIDAALTAVPRRVKLLTAKAVACGLALLATGSLALAGTLAGALPWDALPWDRVSSWPTTGGAAITLGTLRDLVLVGLLGSALALLLRSLVAPLVLMLVLLLIAPHVLAALTVPADVLPGQGGLPCLLIWTTVAWAAAVTRFCRRDA